MTHAKEDDGGGGEGEIDGYVVGIGRIRGGGEELVAWCGGDSGGSVVVVVVITDDGVFLKMQAEGVCGSGSGSVSSEHGEAGRDGRVRSQGAGLLGYYPPSVVG